VSGPKWTNRLPWNDAARAYVGVVQIAGFPYEIKIERDYTTDDKVVVATVAIWQGPGK
jgi:hypothetical protein